jgi:hypothetical protein
MLAAVGTPWSSTDLHRDRHAVRGLRMLPAPISVSARRASISACSAIMSRFTPVQLLDAIQLGSRFDRRDSFD